MSAINEVRAVVVKLNDPDYPEEPWVACCMSERTYEIIGPEDFDEWKRKALELVLADWQQYEIREVVLRVPLPRLRDLFGAPIDVGTRHD